jgi:hypothetical protein
MNDGASAGSGQLDLDAAEQDERDLQIAVSGAQRLLHDEILQQFLSEMRKVGEQYAVYGTTPEARELNRVKVMAIDELRGHLQAMAKVNQDRLDDDERARALE